MGDVLGSGGSTAYSTMEIFQQDVHQVLLEGVDGAAAGSEWEDKFSWDTPTITSYGLNPSVMRYLAEFGLSEPGGNVYEGISPYDPDLAFLPMLQQFDAFRSSLLSVFPASDISEYYRGSELDYDESFAPINMEALLALVIESARNSGSEALSEAFGFLDLNTLNPLVSQALAAYRTRARETHYQAQARLTSGLADINAINSSAFVIGLALLESDYENRLAEKDADFILPFSREAFQGFLSIFLETLRSSLGNLTQVKLREYSGKLAFADSQVSKITGLLQAQLTLDYNSVSLRTEMARLITIAKTEELEKGLEYDALESMWDLTLFQAAANILSASTGSVIPGPWRPSKSVSGLAGAASGAAMGYQAFGAYGAIAGGIIGGLAGYQEGYNG